jgi:Uma2 family endonuclease
MSTLASSRRVSSGEFAMMTNPHRFELVNGELVERPMSFKSSEVAGEIFATIREFVRANNLGRMGLPDGGLQCFQEVFPEDPDRVLFPDVSFVSRDRWPGEIPASGWLKVAPDLVVEVISPNDNAEDVDRKVGWYFRASVRSVWVAYPETQTVFVRHPDRLDRTFGQGDSVEDPAVLPGFVASIEQLFPGP